MTSPRVNPNMSETSKDKKPVIKAPAFSIFFLLGPLGRAALATPFDNLAKRSQVYQGAIGFKDIPKIMFQNGIGAKNIVRNAYAGVSFGLFYKGFQVLTFDATFGLKENIEARLGEENKLLSSVIAGLAVGTVQTLILHPASTIRTRLQVGGQTLTPTEPPNFLKKYPAAAALYTNSPLVSAVSKRHFSRGLTANLCRNGGFLTVTNYVFPSVKAAIVNNHIFGKGDKANEMQESVSRIISGCSGITVSLFFDNVKTKLQVEEFKEGQPKQGMVKMIYSSIKTQGLARNLRAFGPYAVSEALALCGLYAGKALARRIEGEVSEDAENSEKAANKKGR